MPVPRPDLNPGDPVSRIETPALIVDLDAFEANLRTMADYAAKAGMRLRPHAKTHKCAEIAKRQMALGAVGVCCQKVGEAAALVAGGVTDVLVSNEVIHPGKLACLMSLTGRARIGICVDSDLGLDRLIAAAAEAVAPVDVYVELEVGGHRCGVTDIADGLALARRIADSNRLRFGGIHAYRGSAQHLRTADERKAAIDEAAARAAEFAAGLARDGIEVPVVTGAGTGTFTNEASSGVYNEIQPGSYVFMDRDYADNVADPAAPRFHHSLFVLTSVMSRRDAFAVIDAGLKAHSIDSGFPIVADRPDLTFSEPSDEHGIIKGAALPQLGETLRLIPGHCDPTVNLYDWIVAVRGDKVADVWAIDARGALT
ncbi:DSD1 family PLP-dependent enzyme [Dongia sp.]|uniref:DSD1 family PLP-dependent enzyme n=1 Tax=Dongia sp. TaxID=1977262 RepID=UPI0035AE585A